MNLKEKKIQSAADTFNEKEKKEYKRHKNNVMGKKGTKITLLYMSRRRS